MTTGTHPFSKLALRFLALLFLLAAQTLQAAEERVALVIGNSNYDHVSALTNPANDTVDLGAALKRIGFDVTVGQNLDYRGMRLALRDFAEAAATADVVLIYFAGHGVEIDNVNYLIPTNAELRSDRDVEFETVRLDAVIRSIADTPGLKIVLVDACRNNPFLSTMTRTSSTRSLGRGLGRIDPGGVLVGYAARGGTLALDGEGRNSPYAQALLQHIEEPGLELGKLFRKVRDTVYELTDGFQEPFTYGSLPGDDIFLVPAVQRVPAPAPTPAPAPDIADATAEQRTASADQLLREAVRIEDTKVKQGMLDMIARLYPETQSGRTAKYMAEHIQRQLAVIASLGQAKKPPEPSQRVSLPQGTDQVPEPRSAPSNKSIEDALNLSRSDYRIIQRALNDQGFGAGVEDGIFGPRSRSALRNYQSRKGQTRTGYLTASTVAALKAVQPRPRAAEQATPAAQPAPATPQAATVGYDGTYRLEIRRRPDPRWKHEPGEKTMLLLTLDYRKSGDSFTLLNATDHTGRASNPGRLNASLSDKGALRVRGSVNYLFGKKRSAFVSIRRQLPASFSKGTAVVSEHGRFDDAFYVNVKVTRR